MRCTIAINKNTNTHKDMYSAKSTSMNYMDLRVPQLGSYLTFNQPKLRTTHSHLVAVLGAPVFTGGVSAGAPGAPEVAAPGAAQSGSPYAIIVQFNRDYNYKTVKRNLLSFDGLMDVVISCCAAPCLMLLPAFFLLVRVVVFALSSLK